MLPVINYALRKWQTSQKWAFLGKACIACHYCLSHLLFPPSVYRETHLCPAATASGTAFWVVFEHTSVSCVQKLFRLQEYLWVPFDIFTYYTHAHTLCFFLHHPHLKQRSNKFLFFLNKLKNYDSTLSFEKKALLGKAFFLHDCHDVAWTDQISASFRVTCRAFSFHPVTGHIPRWINYVSQNNKE